MADDAGTPEPQDPVPDFALPRVAAVEVGRTRFAPRHRNFASALPRDDEAVEVLVTTDGPVPIRALSPVLFVGEVALTEVSADDDTHYRFVAPGAAVLEAGAPIRLGWTGQRPDEAEATGLRLPGPEG